MKKFFRNPGIRELGRVILAVAFALILGYIITLLVSKKPVEAYNAFLFGPLSRTNRIGFWIVESTTLTLLGLATVLVFRAELFALGMEGQMVLGALVAGCISLFTPFPLAVRITLGLLAAAVVGFLWGVIPGLLKAHLNANELVSTLMLNTIALKIYEWLLTFYIKPPNAGFTASATFPPEGSLPPFLPTGISVSMDKMLDQTKITIMLWLAIIAVFVVYFIMFRTPFGYELRMIGINLKFARYGGVDIKKVIVLSMAISGLFAGLAGAHLAMGVNDKLILNITFGLGFEGVVVALLARNNPLLVPFAALAYGYLRSGADIMERSSDVSREMVLVIEAVIILLVTAERLLPVVQRRIAAHRASVEATAEGGPNA
jgi:ABC-type uncharacterized transport system permease subunit